MPIEFIQSESPKWRYVGVYNGRELIGEIPRARTRHVVELEECELTATELRAIADRLDELNGVKPTNTGTPTGEVEQ